MLIPSRSTFEESCGSVSGAAFLRVGEGLMVMRSRARRGGSRNSGGSPSAISMAVIPNDQRSTFEVNYHYMLNKKSRDYNLDRKLSEVSTFVDCATQLTKVFKYLEVVFLASDKFRCHPVEM